MPPPAYPEWQPEQFMPVKSCRPVTMASVRPV